jgi:hypothetical protein
MMGGNNWTGLLDAHPCNMVLGSDRTGFNLFELEPEACPESLESLFSLRFGGAIGNGFRTTTVIRVALLG